MYKDFNKILFFSLILAILVIIYYINKANDSALYNKILHKQQLISGTIDKIIDGDSLIVAGNEIRLLDIDAPEYLQSCNLADKTEYRCGLKSLKKLKELTKGQNLSCQIHGIDYYKRYLATCFIEKLNINEAMIRSGHAVIYDHNSAYYSAEQYAKENQLGLWQGDFLHPKQYRKLHKK